MIVNIQSPIFTSYLLCVVYTILTFLTDNKIVKCVSKRLRVCMHMYVKFVCVWVGYSQQMTYEILVICSKMLHGL